MPGSAAGLRGRRIVVVGAGVAGITLALTARRLGGRVALVEQAPHVAPLVRGFHRGRHICDVGLHYTGGLGEGGLLRRLLERWGAWEHLEPAYLPRDGFDRLSWANGELVVPVGLQRLEEALRSAFPRSAGAIRSYLDAVRTVMETTPFVDVHVPPGAWRMEARHRSSLAAYLEERGAEPGLVRVLGAYGRFLLGVDERQVSVRMHALLVGTMASGPATFRGGGAALAAALERSLEGHGVEVRTGTRATRLEVRAGAVSGVWLAGGERLAADTVVFTGHPAQLPGFLGDEPLGSSYARRLERAAATPSFLVAFVPGGERAGGPNAYLLDARGAEGGFPVAVMSGAPARPGEESTCALVRDVDPGSFRAARRRGRAAYEELKHRLAMEMIDAVRRAGEDLSRRELVETVTPLSFERWLGVPGGQAYGVRRGLADYHFRPVTPVEGFNLAGQSTLMPGVLGACVSGLVACSLMVGAEAVWDATVR